MTEKQKQFAENLWDSLRNEACVTKLKARQIITLSKTDFLNALEKSLEHIDPYAGDSHS